MKVKKSDIGKLIITAKAYGTILEVSNLTYGQYDKNSLLSGFFAEITEFEYNPKTKDVDNFRYSCYLGSTIPTSKQWRKIKKKLRGK